jgi:hypothetical protein
VGGVRKTFNFFEQCSAEFLASSLAWGSSERAYVMNPKSPENLP